MSEDEVSFKMTTSEEDVMSTNLNLQATGNESAKKEVHKYFEATPNYYTNISCKNDHHLEDADQENSTTHQLFELL